MGIHLDLSQWLLFDLLSPSMVKLPALDSGTLWGSPFPLSCSFSSPLYFLFSLDVVVEVAPSLSPGGTADVSLPILQ